VGVSRGGAVVEVLRYKVEGRGGQIQRYGQSKGWRGGETAKRGTGMVTVREKGKRQTETYLGGGD
jgi:hypothetical protein